MVEGLDLRAIDQGLAGFLNQAGQQIQSAAHAKRAVIGEQVLQVEVCILVVSIAGLFEGAGIDIEPLGDTDSEAEGGDFHDRDVVAASVEGDERGFVVVGPALPEAANNFLRSELRSIEYGDVEELPVA